MVCRAIPLNAEVIRFSLCQVMTYLLAGRAITAPELRIYKQAAMKRRGGRIVVAGTEFDLSNPTKLFAAVERRLLSLADKGQITFWGTRFDGGVNTSGLPVAVPVEFLRSGVWLDPMSDRICSDLNEPDRFGLLEEQECQFTSVYLPAEEVRQIRSPQVIRPHSGFPELAVRTWLAARQERNDWASGPADHAACQAELGRTFARDPFLALRREYLPRRRGRPRKIAKT